MAATNGYPLGRGYIPATRLNLQQYIWRDTLGYSLHPRIPSGAVGLKIADVGTGTGLWLLHVASNVSPSCHLYGYDVSADQFIPADHLPDNIELNELDATEAPPHELQGTFDIVHVRLLQLIINNNDPGPILDHCVKLLKPSGYLQWDEIDPAAQVLRRAVGQDAKSLSILSGYATSTRPISWIRKLPDLLEQRGLDVTAVDRRREITWQRGMLLEINAILSEEFANGLEIRGEGEKASQLRDLTRSAEAEGRHGSYVSHLFQVVVAQKSVH